jgi:hypothetical protein
MPSQLHEALLLLFRNRPSLAPELLCDALHVELPEYTEARIDSADLTDIQPASIARTLSCCCCMGAGNLFTPLVLGPSGVPEVTDPERARADPELAVLSAMAHGRATDTRISVQIALAAHLASMGLDPDRARLYFDRVVNALSEAAKRELRTKDPAKYEYQSDWVKQWLAHGKAQGEMSGRAALVTKLLTRRFGPLTDAAKIRVSGASVKNLMPSANACSPHRRWKRHLACIEARGAPQCRHCGAETFEAALRKSPARPMAMKAMRRCPLERRFRARTVQLLTQRP